MKWTDRAIVLSYRLILHSTVPWQSASWHMYMRKDEARLYYLVIWLMHPHGRFIHSQRCIFMNRALFVHVYVWVLDPWLYSLYNNDPIPFDACIHGGRTHLIVKWAQLPHIKLWGDRRSSLHHHVPRLHSPQTRNLLRMPCAFCLILTKTHKLDKKLFKMLTYFILGGMDRRQVAQTWKWMSNMLSTNSTCTITPMHTRPRTGSLPLFEQQHSKVNIMLLIRSMKHGFWRAVSQKKSASVHATRQMYWRYCFVERMVSVPGADGSHSIGDMQILCWKESATLLHVQKDTYQTYTSKHENMWSKDCPSVQFLYMIQCVAPNFSHTKWFL